MTGGADEPVLRVMGVYDERYRREDGRWKISRMDLTFLWNSDVGRIRAGRGAQARLARRRGDVRRR